ncbi:MAG: hypothetical protein BZY80_05215 [SAR202 cluster bacterium Io17-Chloro-G2]|nr:MAG: hypothetical protein BZY80_05215 [SAR202 cluster bacterium Io17-Chloro-G2]
MPILPEFSLAGRAAILATSGGDQAPLLAQALVEAGASVFTIARTQPLLDAVLDGLPGTGNQKGAVIGSPSSESLRTAMAEFGLAHGRLDILVNDNRSMFAKPFTEITLEEWDEVHSRNVKFTFMLCQEAGLRMTQQGYGRIVNVVSELAERGMANGAAFAASQASLLSLTRSLGVEWGRSNVRVNALGMGWFSSEDLPLEVQREDLVVRYTPLRRLGHPRDIGPLLVYLCSEACDYTTGQPVYVDGGLNAHP